MVKLDDRAEAEFKIVLVKDDQCCKNHFVAILMYQISLIQNFMPEHLDKYNSGRYV